MKGISIYMNNNNIKTRKNKYLSRDELNQIEGMLALNNKIIRYVDKKEKRATVIKRKKKLVKLVKEIAEYLNRGIRTIEREIERGLVEQKDNLHFKYLAYSADASWKLRVDASKNKRKSIKADKESLEYIAESIKLKNSAYATIEKSKRKNIKLSVCEKTIYNYINNGVLEPYGVNKDSLLYKYRVKKKTRKTQKRQIGLSVEFRPEIINIRGEIGHWEIDTVKGTLRGKSTSLLVLTERYSRLEIIRKIDSCKAEIVKNTVEKILKSNKYLIKTITSDNGVEFHKGMEVKGVTWYYCHPYCSFERGSNEVQNKIIRKFIPKGTKISKYSVKEINMITEHMNNYPRKMFGGRTSKEIYEEKIKA